MKVWTPEQMRTFLESVAHHRLFAAWLLISTTGMRRGEVLGLAWDHVDLQRGRISVVRSLTVVNYRRVEYSEPKTAKGRRSLSLDPTTVDGLKPIGKAQREERLAAGPIWQNTRLVFTPRTARRSIPNASRPGSSSFPAMRACRRSGCTISVTATQPRHSAPASRPKW